MNEYQGMVYYWQCSDEEGYSSVGIVFRDGEPFCDLPGASIHEGDRQTNMRVRDALVAKGISPQVLVLGPCEVELHPGAALAEYGPRAAI